MAEIVDFGLQQHKIKMDSRYFENVLSVVAGDTGRRIEVQLLDTNGTVQDTTGLNLRLNAVIAGKATYTDATLVDAATGKYQLDLSNGMFLAPGNWQFQWQITDAAGKKLHSFAFTGNVGSNISEGGSQATNFYLNLEDLKAMQDDLVNGTFNSEALETNIAGKLETLEETYAPRLTEVTAQLAQTHKKDEQSVGWNNIQQDAREIMLGEKPMPVVGKDSVGKSNIVDNGVGLEHVSFLDKDEVFDGTYMEGYIVSTTALDHRKNPSFPSAVSAVLPIIEGKRYVIKKGTSDRFRVMTSETFLPDASNPAKRVIADYAETEIDTIDFKAEKGERFVAIQVSNTGEKPQLNVLSIKMIADKSVDFSHVSFAEKKDIFNGEYLTGYALVTGATAFGVGYPSSTVVIEKITPGKKYSIVKNDPSDRFRIATFTEYPTKHEQKATKTHLDITASNPASTHTFIGEEGENYLVIQLSNSNETPSINVYEEGLVGAMYGSEYIEKNDIFDGVYHEGLLVSVTGNTVRFDKGTFPGATSVLAKIVGGKRYKITKQNSDRFRIATLNDFVADKVNIPNKIESFDGTGINEFEFKADSGDNYLVIQITNTGEKPNIKIQETGLAGVVYQSMFDPQSVQSKQPKLVGKFNELYTTEPTEDVTANSVKPLSDTTIDDIYFLYDELMQRHSLHFSKTLRGYGSTSEGTEDTTLPIYEYVVKAPENDNMTGGDFIGKENTITALISTGVHGNEKNPVWSLYLFIKQMMENYKTNDVMMSLKSNIIFKIMPIANPGGYNDSTRQNRNGVNINRNFEYNFAVVGEGTGINYSGQEPYSELETRVMRDWFEDNKNANVYIDYHAFSYNMGENTISYHISKNPELDSLYASLMRVLSYKWKDKYFPNVNENEALGYNNSSSYTNVATSVSETYHKYGIELSGTVETGFYGPDGTMYSPVVVETGVELLAGYLLAIVDKYFA